MTLQQMTDNAQFLDLASDVLDRQVSDRDDLQVCKVDDLEFTQGEDGLWRVSAILLGPGALGPRIGGWLGAVMVGIHRRMRGQQEPNPPRIPWSDVAAVGSEVSLSTSRSELPRDLTPLEDWLREHVIHRIPGSDHASQ